MSERFSEEFQARGDADGKLYFWRRGEKPPMEVRWKICPRCKVKSKVTKTEFAGEKGKIWREYRCPQCGQHIRTIRRQRVKDSKYVLKEPERRKNSPVE